MKLCKLLLCRALLFLTAASAPAATNGPTIFLRDETSRAMANPMAEFMYFVPLISPQPVASLVSRDAAQSVRMISMTRRASGNSFSADCEMEVKGDGWQRSVFDLGPAIHRHERQLEAGESLHRQLKSIEVDGAGWVDVEVRGAVTNNIPTVNEVRLHFNGRGRASPVWIRMCDVCRRDDGVHSTNNIVARVNTLTFRRESGPPKMEVAVAAIKSQGARDGFWQNLKGAVEGFAANFFIAPLAIETAGNRAMMDFGAALIEGAPKFTFPLAKNLRPSPIQDGIDDAPVGPIVPKR